MSPSEIIIYLEMVGVELRAMHARTRMMKGDKVVKRVQSKLGLWRGGRFTPLTQRPWSLNTYALSKVWYRSNCIDLRVKDIAAISSKIKAWLYMDQFEKPEDIVTYRPISEGGLGLDHVRYKALSRLIKSFLETSCSTDYIHHGSR